MGLISKVWDATKTTCRKAVAAGRKALVMGAIALVLVASTGQHVAAQVTLPDLGVDIDGHVTAAGSDLGTIVSTVIGIAFVFMVVKMGLSWARKLRG